MRMYLATFLKAELHSDALMTGGSREHLVSYWECAAAKGDSVESYVTTGRPIMPEREARRGTVSTETKRRRLALADRLASYESEA